MHVLLVADGRSPHTAGWMSGMVKLGITITLLSSRLIGPDTRADLDALIGDGRIFQPTDVWNRTRPHLTRASPSRVRPAGNAPVPRRRALHDRVAEHLALPALSALESYAASRLSSQLRSVVAAVRPAAVHALRVHYEGMVAAGSRIHLPVAVSTWGQDLVSTAVSSRRLGQGTTSALHRADVLMADCQRDASLAGAWGLRRHTPTHVIPGNFGVDLARFPQPDPRLSKRLGLAAAPLIVYPRGVRDFVNFRGFIEAARTMVSEGVDASFLGVGLSGVAGRDGHIPGSLVCTGPLAHRQMLSIAASSAVTVSPAWSDGMPNSVLEGMAGGSIPVCGDIESVRELAAHGAVIAWCDPSRADSIASGIRAAIRMSADPVNRDRNRTVIADHYSVSSSLDRARAAYADLACRRPVPHHGSRRAT